MTEKIIFRQTGKDQLYKTWHTSEDHMIIFIHSGNGSIVCNEKIYPIKPGVLCFVGGQKYHYTMPDDPGNYTRSKLLISPGNLKKISALFPDNSIVTDLFTPDSVVYAQIPEQYTENISLIFKKAHQQRKNSLFCETLLCSCFTELMVYLCRNTPESISTPAGGIHKAIEYINNNICDILTVDKICNAAHMSKYHFCRKFKNNTGLTVMEYILKTRLVMAKHILIKEKASVTEVSNRCGFSSVAYFSRIFKQQTGFSPKEYRKNPPHSPDIY